MTHGEILALVGGGALLLGGAGALWYFSQNRTSATTTPTPSTPSASSPSASGTLPTLQVAPQQLPSFVTRRCGTVYVSFGLAPSNAQYIVVGQYTNGQLIVQYYQSTAFAPSFNSAGSWTGGYACGGSGSSAPSCQTHYKVPAYTGSNALDATMSGIAIKFHTTISAIIAANPQYSNLSASYVQSGWTLCIPS